MNGWKFWKVLKMSLHDYLELFRQAIENIPIGAKHLT
jgi:hypothetical protein